MKSIIKDEKIKSELPFPKLMINDNGCIRIVYKNLSSAILLSATNFEFNRTDEPGDWDYKDFTEFTGSITLSND